MYHDSAASKYSKEPSIPLERSNIVSLVPSSKHCSIIQRHGGVEGLVQVRRPVDEREREGADIYIVYIHNECVN